MASVTRLHHLGAVVRSMDDALRFFRDGLGLPLLVEQVIEDQGVRAALLDLGNAYLELLQPTVLDTGIARYLERRGEGLHHVCLETPDIHAALAELKANAVPLVDETPRAGLTGTIAFLHPSALHGVLVELVHAPTAYRNRAPALNDALAPANRGSGFSLTGPLRRLDHLVLAVQELAPAADAWSRVLGLRAEPPYHPERSHMQLARLPLSDDAQGGAYLELAQPTTPDHRLARFIAGRGEGMFSISIEVDDLDAAVPALRARGLPASDPEPGAWPHTRLARIPRANAHGVAVQLIERM